jgi:alcohol-forming fatty acyl-CoA reductase
MDIKNFYKDKTIFLTGTTGFVGKVVLEKLLRSLSGCKRIYLMVRAKKSMTVQQRMLDSIFTSEIFDRVFSEQPNLRAKITQKVVPIAGDLVIDRLGISAEDRAILVAEVDIIINCAASVNFDDPVLDAI